MKDADNNFIETYNAIACIAFQNAIDRGWWDAPRDDGTMIALMHSELSEALEGLRKPSPDEHCPEFTSLEVELADVIIRIMDYGEKKELRIAEALVAKMEYNRTRPYKHGGKNF